MTDRSSVIFGNKMPDKVYKKAVKSKKKYMKKFGDDSRKNYEVSVEKNRYIGDSLGVYNILVGNPAENAQFVAELIKKRLGIENFLINHIGPTISAHSGPGTIALFYMGDYR